MAPFATSEDVAAQWRPLTDDQVLIVDELLDYASAILRQRVGLIDDRLADGTLDPVLVRGVAVAMVLRVMRNPDGIRQRTAGAVSVTFDDARAAGIDPTPSELSMLAPRRAGRGAPRSARLCPGLGL